MKQRISKLFINLLFVVMTFTAIIPFIYMLFTSFRQVYSLTDFNFQLSDFNFDNYRAVFTNMPFLTYFKNSMIIVVCSCALNIAVSALAGYGFAKKRFKGRDLLFSLFLATMMIPGQVTIIPVFTMLNVFMMKQFMEGIPNELIEAAKIDGSGEIRTFFSIVIPLVKPVIISLTTFTFITVWNDFIWPLVVVSTDDMTTLTLGLSTLQGLYLTNYGLVMAGATLTFIVPFTLYIFLQKQFVEGIALSGIKG